MRISEHRQQDQINVSFALTFTAFVFSVERAYAMCCECGVRVLVSWGKLQ